MVGPRVPERYDDEVCPQGTMVGEEVVSAYDVLQKQLRDQGILPVETLIAYGFERGIALEIGPGAGYVGLEWLKKTENTVLYWLEISEDMNVIARKNAGQYGLEGRISLVISDATKRFPFDDDTFDLIFTNNSLHEWDKPEETFNEIQRVLKSNGKYFINDLKRNISPGMISTMKNNLPADENMRRRLEKGLTKSIEASYLREELIEILSKTGLENWEVKEDPVGLTVVGAKT